MHIQIVANIALKLLRQLTKHRVEPALVRDYGMSRDDAEVVVVLERPLRRDGNSPRGPRGLEPVSRRAEDEDARRDLRGAGAGLLAAWRCSARSRVTATTSLTIEAGIVCVADALDMAKGRSRIPFEHGLVSIHSLSAAAIDAVAIKDGERTRS